MSEYDEGGIAMTIKDLGLPFPGRRQFSLLRQRLHFSGSANFWEDRYASGGTSGPGSYGELAQGKAEFLNTFVHRNDLRSVIEFGCGDGNQLSLADYPRYVGFDVSRAAIGVCKRRFAGDSSKSFFLYDGNCFVDHIGFFTADVAISLDVIYHLVEDNVYELYMKHLFGAARRYVVIYSTNGLIRDDAPHVLHRDFCSWVDKFCSEWHQSQLVEGPGSGARRADFYVYERS